VANASPGTGDLTTTLPASCSDEDVQYLREFDQRERNVVDSLSN
jgi:hypothetical protein